MRFKMIEKEVEKMEELLEILNEIDDSIDYENETALIDDHHTCIRAGGCI